MKKLELFYFPQCPYCQIVLEALRVTGLEEKVTYSDIHSESHKKEELVKMTGKSTVPVMLIDGKPMSESKDIAKWLHEYSKDIQNEANAKEKG